MNQTELLAKVYEDLLYEINKPLHLNEHNKVLELLDAIEELGSSAVERAFNKYMQENDAKSYLITTEEDIKKILNQYNDGNEQFIK